MSIYDGSDGRSHARKRPPRRYAVAITVFGLLCVAGGIYSASLARDYVGSGTWAGAHDAGLAGGLFLLFAATAVPFGVFLVYRSWRGVPDSHGHVVAELAPRLDPGEVVGIAVPAASANALRHDRLLVVTDRRILLLSRTWRGGPGQLLSSAPRSTSIAPPPDAGHHVRTSALGEEISISSLWYPELRHADRG
jgi:hypothetical protein